MLILQVGENYQLGIKQFVEMKDHYDRPGMHFIRIDFDTLEPYGKETIRELGSIFKTIPFLKVTDTHSNELRIDGQIVLYRITRDASSGKLALSVHLTIFDDE